MPFASKAQWRAAFAQRIKGFSPEKAHEWAKESPPYDSLPEKVKAAALAEFCKEARALLTPAPFGTKDSNPLGTPPPTPPKSNAFQKNVVNPRRSLRQAMTVGLK